MDWDTALDFYLMFQAAEGRSPNTIKWHRHILGKFVAWQRDRGKAGPGDLIPLDMTAWVAYMRTRPSAKGGTLAPGAIWSFTCSVKAFLAWCVDQDVIDKDPAAKTRILRGKHLPNPFTDEELKKMWKAVARDTGIKGARNRAILAFLMDTGVRAGELCGLDLDAIVWDQRMALVTGKGDKQRMVAFGPQAAVVLKRWTLFRDPELAAMFQTSRKTRWTPNALLHWVNRLGDRAGVDHAHPHRFRATFATQMAESGDLFAVQAQLGHTTLDQTRRYAAVAAMHVRTIHDRTSPMNRVLKKGHD